MDILLATVQRQIQTLKSGARGPGCPGGAKGQSPLEDFGILRLLNAQKCHPEALRMAEGSI